MALFTATKKVEGNIRNSVLHVFAICILFSFWLLLLALLLLLLCAFAMLSKYVHWGIGI